MGWFRMMEKTISSPFLSFFLLLISSSANLINIKLDVLEFAKLNGLRLC